MEWVEVETLIEHLETARLALIDAKATNDRDNALLNDAYFALVTAQRTLNKIINIED